MGQEIIYSPFVYIISASKDDCTDDLNIQFKLFEDELSDFKHEMAHYEAIFDILLTGGHLITNTPLMSLSGEFIQKIFANYLSSKQIDLEMGAHCAHNMRILLDLNELSDELADARKTILDYRKQILAHIYYSTTSRLRTPLTLQELCRFQIRVSTRFLNENLRYNAFKLSQNLKNFLVYE